MTEEEKNNKFTQELLAGSEPISEESLREFMRKVEAFLTPKEYDPTKSNT